MEIVFVELTLSSLLLFVHIHSHCSAPYYTHIDAHEEIVTWYSTWCLFFHVNSAP